MSNFKIVNQPEWHAYAWGWYCQTTKHDPIRIKLKQYVEYQGDVEYLINDLPVFVFCGFDDQWWIGANFIDQRNKFTLMGPYANHEEALTIMLLHSVISRD